MYVHVCIYIYIYICRERERLYVCKYIYIYIYELISQGLGDINNLVEVVPGQCRFGRLYIMMYSVYIYKYIVWICMCIYIYIYTYIHTYRLCRIPACVHVQVCWLSHNWLTPSSHSKNSLSKICSKGWVALQGNTYTICAKIFQGLGPKRPES